MSETGICATATSYFAELFQFCMPCQIEEIERCMDARVTLEDNLALKAPVLDGEIKEAAFQIPSTRAPGPDGFTKTIGRLWGRMW